MPAAPPEDSILPLSDGEIDAITGSYFVTSEPMTLRAGSLATSVPAGTTITPVDTFVAAMIRSSLGRRPIHFMSSSPVVATLGLSPYTVRVGLTWKLRDSTAADPRLVALPADGIAQTGAYIDMLTTDTLAADVFIRRGRVMDPHKAWVDHATWSMPAQYSLMHYAAAIGHDLQGRTAESNKHLEQLKFWNGKAGSF